MAIAAKINLDTAHLKMSERREEKTGCSTLPVLVTFSSMFKRQLFNQ
jgi:hypothetical protein